MEAGVCLREKFGGWATTGRMVNINETGQSTWMAVRKLSATTVKRYEGITVKGGGCPANDLVGNQIF